MRYRSKKQASYRFVSRSVRRLFPVYAAISVVSGIATIIDSLCCSVFLGPLAVASVGLITPVNNFLWMFVNTIVGGAIVICGQKLGRGEVETVKQIFSSVILLFLFIGAVFGLCDVLFAPHIVRFLGASELLVPFSEAYLRGLTLQIPALLIHGTLVYFAAFNGGERWMMISYVLVTVGDAFLDILFVKILGLGMFGMGLASSLSILVGVLVLIPQFLDQKNCVSFVRSGKGMRYLKDSVITGLPTFSNELCSLLQEVSINILIVHHAGENGLAALAVANIIIMFMKSFVYGMRNVCTSQGSVYYGVRDEESMIDMIMIDLKCGLVYSIPAVVCLLVFAKQIISWFSGGSETVAALAFPAVMLIPVHMTLLALFVVINSAYIIQGKIRLAIGTSMMAYLILPLIFANILIPVKGTWGLWLTWIAVDLLSLIMILALVGFRMKKVLISIDDLFTFGDHFQVPLDDRIALTITNMQNVITASKFVQDFSTEHGIGRTEAKYAGLAVEEMAGNIIRHGFKDGKEHLINLVVSYLKEDRTIHISIMDDCQYFDPVKYSDQFKALTDHDPEKPEEHIGIRMIASIAREMSYRNFFHLNALDITI